MLLTLAAVLLAQNAAPPVPQTMEEAREMIAADSSCQRTDYPDLSMVLHYCEESSTGWYLTVPDDDLPPGWVRRRMYRNDDGGISMATSARFYGSDEQEAAFLDWIKAIERSIGG